MSLKEQVGRVEPLHKNLRAPIGPPTVVLTIHQSGACLPNMTGSSDRVNLNLNLNRVVLTTLYNRDHVLLCSVK